MNPVVKAQLNEFKKTNNPAGYSECDLFEVYTIYAVANGFLNESIDPFQAHLKGSEFGLDGACVIIDGELCVDSDNVSSALDNGKNSSVDFVFIQAKTSEKFDYGDVSKFLDAVVGFFSGAMRGESEQLDDLIAAKELVYQAPLKQNPSLRCYFASTGGIDAGSHIRKLVESNQGRLDQLNLFSNIEIELIGAKALQEMYRRATNSMSATIEFGKSITLPEHDSVDQAYIGYIEAKELLRLISSNGTEDEKPRVNRSVFFDNIRDFNINSDINRSIISELKKKQNSSFVFKNNGITVVAKGISRTGDKFRLDDYQIVNGCQTSNIIFACRERLDDVHVPIRIIGTKDPEFIASIIIGTNKQNEVKEEQFWALKPFLKDLEEYCRNQPADRMILLERREFQYRDESSVERTRIIKPRDLMKAVAGMFLFRPHRAARDYRGIRKEFEAQIFIEGHNVQPYHCAALASYRFDFAIRNQRVKRSWGIYKYYSLFSLGVQSTRGVDVFRASKKTQAEICEGILDLLSDEAKWISHIEIVSEQLDLLFGKRVADSREQVRDGLRTESVARQYSSEIGFEHLITQ